MFLAVLRKLAHNTSITTCIWSWPKRLWVDPNSKTRVIVLKVENIASFYHVNTGNHIFEQSWQKVHNLHLLSLYCLEKDDYKLRQTRRSWVMALILAKLLYCILFLFHLLSRDYSNFVKALYTYSHNDQVLAHQKCFRLFDWCTYYASFKKHYIWSGLKTNNGFLKCFIPLLNDKDVTPTQLPTLTQNGLIRDQYALESIIGII